MLVYISVDDCVYIRIHGLRHSVCYKENGDFAQVPKRTKGEVCKTSRLNAHVSSTLTLCLTKFQSLKEII